MTGRFLYRCIICLTRLVNSFLFCLRLVLRSVPDDLIPTDFVPADFVPADFVPADFVPVGFVPVGSDLVGLVPVPLVDSDSVGPVDFDLSGKHVVDFDSFSFVGACSTATFWSNN